MSDPVYVVGAIMRSLKTMTAGAILASSEILPAHTPSRKDRYEAAIDNADYKFNDGKLWDLEYCPPCTREMNVRANVHDGSVPECDRDDCLAHMLTFPQDYTGRLYAHNIDRPGFPLKGDNYKVLVLARDYDVIRYSGARALGYDFADTVPPLVAYGFVMSFFLDAPDALMVKSDRLVRPETKHEEWRRIADAGWPIDPDVAAGHCDHRKVHYWKETVDTSVPPCDGPTPATEANLALFARDIGVPYA